MKIKSVINTTYIVSVTALVINLLTLVTLLILTASYCLSRKVRV